MGFHAPAESVKLDQIVGRVTVRVHEIGQQRGNGAVGMIESDGPDVEWLRTPSGFPESTRRRFARRRQDEHGFRGAARQDGLDRRERVLCGVPLHEPKAHLGLLLHRFVAAAGSVQAASRIERLAHRRRGGQAVVRAVDGQHRVALERLVDQCRTAPVGQGDQVAVDRRERLPSQLGPRPGHGAAVGRGSAVPVPDATVARVQEELARRFSCPCRQGPGIAPGGLAGTGEEAVSD